MTASVLLRRGYDDPSAARRFLDAELPGHDPLLLGDMEPAVERIRAAIGSGARICVHGDYDVDGICATALAVLLLRELGADVSWHLPSRFEEGYGVSHETLGRLADEVARDVPNVTVFAGKLVFREENFMSRLLHNQTSFLVQKKLVHQGLPMLIMPIRAM